MSRTLFLRAPWYVRLRRWYRCQSMAIPNQRKSDPSERPISIHKALLWTVIVCVVAAAYYLGEAVERNRGKLMPGLYNPTPPTPRATVDCGAEAMEICKVQKRMSKVKA